MHKLFTITENVGLFDSVCVRCTYVALPHLNPHSSVKCIPFIFKSPRQLIFGLNARPRYLDGEI